MNSSIARGFNHGWASYMEKEAADWRGALENAFGAINPVKAAWQGGGVGGVLNAGRGMAKIRSAYGQKLDDAAWQKLKTDAAGLETERAKRTLTNEEHDLLGQWKARKAAKDAGIQQEADGSIDFGKHWKSEQFRKAHLGYLGRKAATGAVTGAGVHAAGQGIGGAMAQNKLKEYALPIGLGAAGLAGVAAMNRD